MVKVEGLSEDRAFLFDTDLASLFSFDSERSGIRCTKEPKPPSSGSARIRCAGGNEC